MPAQCGAREEQENTPARALHRAPTQRSPSLSTVKEIHCFQATLTACISDAPPGECGELLLQFYRDTPCRIIIRDAAAAAGGTNMMTEAVKFSGSLRSRQKVQLLHAYLSRFQNALSCIMCGQPDLTDLLSCFLSFRCKWSKYNLDARHHGRARCSHLDLASTRRLQFALDLPAGDASPYRSNHLHCTPRRNA